MIRTLDELYSKITKRLSFERLLKLWWNQAYRDSMRKKSSTNNSFNLGLEDHSLDIVGDHDTQKQTNLFFASQLVRACVMGGRSRI